MEIKLFGKQLFEVKKSMSEIFLGQANTANKESKYLPDFFGSMNPNSEFSDYVIMPSDSTGGAVAVPVKKDKKENKVKLTPKGVFEMKLLNDKTFSLNTDSEYVDSQIADFKDKLSLIKSEEYDMRRGVEEISSVLLRLENRKKYSEFKDYYEQFPYTTTTKINEVTKANDYLKCGQVAQFLADMPKEAVAVMKEYEANTKKLCEKKPVFYIIADKKDFNKTNGRRDPILLAQSPFGHFWQILGAWDKEMLLLEKL